MPASRVPGCFVRLRFWLAEDRRAAPAVCGDLLCDPAHTVFAQQPDDFPRKPGCPDSHATGVVHRLWFFLLTVDHRQGLKRHGRLPHPLAQDSCLCLQEYGQRAGSPQSASCTGYYRGC